LLWQDSDVVHPVDGSLSVFVGRIHEVELGLSS
jgi:hypothetical protein